MHRLTRFWAALGIVFIFVLAIGPGNFSYFIHVPSLFVVIVPTWLGLFMAFGYQGYAQLFRWALANTNQHQHDAIARIGYCGALLSLGFGALGSMIGLVLMLQGLDDPSALGPGMALAALTAIYGVTQAAIIFVPMMFVRPSKDTHDGDTPSMPPNGSLLLLAFTVFPWAIMGKIFLLLALAMAPVQTERFLRLQGHDHGGVEAFAGGLATADGLRQEARSKR